MAIRGTRSLLPLVVLLGLLAQGCSDAPTPSPAPPTAAEPQVVATRAQMLGPWSALPFVAPPEIAAAADRACRAGEPLLADARIVVLDVRGAAAVEAWFAGPSSAGSCDALTIDLDGTVAWTGGGKASGGGDYCAGVGPQGLRIYDRQLLDLNGVVGIGAGDVLIRSTVAGCAGRALASVWIQSPQMAPVRATFGNGWFGAWMPGAWPSDGQLVGLGPEGQELVRVPLFR